MDTRCAWRRPLSAIGKAIGKVVGGITGASAAADAANNAAQLQADAAARGEAGINRRFDEYQKLINPFVQAGTGALTQQGNLIGLNGGTAQTAAIDALRTSPEFIALSQQGQEAILANASATGGLRGGNVQGALAQFQPALLAQLINQQYSRLGGLSTLGANAAAGVGSAGMDAAGLSAQLQQQGGAALAGGVMAQGSVPRQAFGDLLSIGSIAAGAGAFNGMVGGGGGSSGVITGGGGLRLPGARF